MLHGNLDISNAYKSPKIISQLIGIKILIAILPFHVI